MPYAGLVRRAVVVVLAFLALVRAGMAQDPTAAALIKLENAWGAASINRDGDAVGRLLADGFLSFTEKGTVNTKAKLVASIKADTTHYVSGANSKYQVKAHGNTAVIIGVWTVTTKSATGNVTRSFAWTDTWMKQGDGTWLCIASQATPVM